MKKYSKQKAIGLLELMLVFAVIAVASIATIRYYSNAQQSQKINQSIQQFGEIKGAFSNYLTDNNNNYTIRSKTVQVYQLVRGGYLPDSYGSTPKAAAASNPYGGSVTLSVSGGLLTMQMSGIPSGACDPIVNRLQSSMNASLSESATAKCKSEGGSANVVTANYVM